MHKIICFLSFLALLFTASSPVAAAAFTIDSIGNIPIINKNISSWSDTGLRPTIKGTAQPNSEVLITFDDEAFKSMADTYGKWEYLVPENRGSGSHIIELSNNDTKISFTLVLGATNTTSSTTSSSSSAEVVTTLPQTGTGVSTLILPLVGLAMLLLSAKIVNVAKRQ